MNIKKPAIEAGNERFEGRDFRLGAAD